MKVSYPMTIIRFTVYKICLCVDPPKSTKKNYIIKAKDIHDKRNPNAFINEILNVCVTALACVCYTA